MTRSLLLLLAFGFGTTVQAQDDYDRPLSPPPRPVAAPAPPPPPGDGHDESYSHNTVDLSAPPDFSGVLDDQDSMQQGKPYDEYIVEVDQGDEVTVTMTAQEFDTYLIVRSPSGREWTNDDFGDTRTSQVQFNATTSGRYVIWATAYSDSGRGAYEVRVTSAAATIVSTVSGRLDYDDMQLIKGEYYDEVTIQATTQDEFYVDLMPLGFTGYMRVTSPSGERQTAQQQYGVQSVRVGPFQPQRGMWTVEVTTVSAGEVGAYDVRVITLDE